VMEFRRIEKPKARKPRFCSYGVFENPSLPATDPIVCRSPRARPWPEYGVYALGLTERGAKSDDRRFIVLRPFHPSLHACLLPLLPLLVIGRLPLCESFGGAKIYRHEFLSSVFSLSKINPVLIIRRFRDRILLRRTIAALTLRARLGIE
jgi:hypothetical protein